MKEVYFFAAAMFIGVAVFAQTRFNQLKEPPGCSKQPKHQ